jgi:hypothetical protein
VSIYAEAAAKYRPGSGATCPHGWGFAYCNECGDVQKLWARIRGLEEQLRAFGITDGTVRR